MNDASRFLSSNFDTKIAFSAAVGAAGLGVFAYAMHRSNVKALEKVAKIATGKATK